jgi:hypothetical protein
MERSTIKYAVISFTLIAFILFLVNGSVTTHYIKQNTAISNVKGFTAYSNITYLNGSGIVNVSNTSASFPISLSTKYNILIGFFIEGYVTTYPPANLLYTNSQTGVNDTTPGSCTRSNGVSSTPGATCLYNFTEVQGNNLYVNKGYMNITSSNYIGGNTVSVYSGLIGLSGQYENITHTPSFQYVSGKWYSFYGTKGQNFIYVSNTSASFPGAFTSCKLDEYSSDYPGYYPYYLYIYFCSITANANINFTTSAVLSYSYMLVQKPQSLSFQSNFNYVGSSCLYDYGYEPSAELTYPFKSNLSVSAVQPITAQTLRYTTSFVLV